MQKAILALNVFCISKLAKTQNYHPGIGQYSHREIKNGETRSTSWGKSMTEFKFYNQLDPGTKDTKI